MNTVTKLDLAQILHDVATAIDNGSTETIRNTVNQLIDSAPPAKPKPSPPENDSLWGDRSNGFIYKVLHTHTLTGETTESVLLQRYDPNPSRFEGVPNRYILMSEFHNRFSESDRIRNSSSIPYWGEPFEPKPVIPTQIPRIGTKWSNNKSGVI